MFIIFNPRKSLKDWPFPFSWFIDVKYDVPLQFTLLYCSNWNETKFWISLYATLLYVLWNSIIFNCQKVKKKITVTAVSLENLCMSYENAEIILDGMNKKISTKQWGEKKKVLLKKGCLKFSLDINAPMSELSGS